MTVLDKRNRIERLATDPLFFYRTLRDHVEQLDSVKAAFQYLLAAYESTMDPQIKVQYEEAKREAREAQLKEIGKSAPPPAQDPDKMMHEFVEKLAQPFPGMTTLTNPESTRVDGSKASGMPHDLKPDAIPKAPRPISPRAGVGAAIAGIAATARTAAEGLTDGASTDAAASGLLTPDLKGGVTVWGNAVVQQGENNPLVALSTESILEAKRILSRKRVAEEVNKVLIQNGIHFTDEQLIDYMDNKISKEELEKLGLMIEERDKGISNPLEKPVSPPATEPHDEFPLTQVGMAQKMFFGEDGLLPKILGGNLTRYGKGPIDKPDRTTRRFFGHDHPSVLQLENADESGIYQWDSGRYGLLIVLDKTDQHPWKYFVWMDLYHSSHVLPPTIWCTKYPAHGFDSLQKFTPAEVSDIVNRLVHYIAKWQALVMGRSQSITSRQGNPAQMVELLDISKAVRELDVGSQEKKLLADSKEYPIMTKLGQVQRYIYGPDGILSLLLGPNFHAYGHGPVRELTGECTAEPTVILPGDSPIMGFTLDPVVRGVWKTDNLQGVFIPGDKGIGFWLPLWTDSSTDMPSIYVAITASTYRNMDILSPKDIDVLSSHLLINLEMWLKQL